MRCLEMTVTLRTCAPKPKYQDSVGKRTRQGLAIDDLSKLDIISTWGLVSGYLRDTSIEKD
jgi:hypothetical protein